MEILWSVSESSRNSNATQLSMTKFVSITTCVMANTHLEMLSNTEATKNKTSTLVQISFLASYLKIIENNYYLKVKLNMWNGL